MPGGPQRELDGTWHTDLEPGYYDQVFSTGRGIQWFWHQLRFQSVLDHLPAGGESILDLGCGPGTFLGNFSSGFERSLGIDLSEAQIAFASARYGSDRLRFERTDIAAFSTETLFDAIVSIEVIEHLTPDETRGFLRSIFQHLKPGGVLVLTTPNYRSLWPMVEWLISTIGPIDYRSQHINPFNQGRLHRELAAAGFQDIRSRTFFVASPFLAAISTGLAQWCYRLEQQLLPRLGSEIVIAGRKPPTSTPG